MGFIHTADQSGQPEGRQERVEACTLDALRVGAAAALRWGLVSGGAVATAMLFSPLFGRSTRGSSRTALFISPIVGACACRFLRKEDALRSC